MADKKPNTEQLRAQAAMLLTQARSQAANVQRALQALGGDGVLNSELSAAAAQLSGAISDLEGAIQSPSFTLRSADLMAIQSIVQSGAVNAALTQAATQATAQAAARTVAATAAETRTETQSIAHDVFDKKIFDKYLRFSSPEDEAEYRKREAEAKRYIAEQSAKHTPEGDLAAAGGVQSSMLDAHLHGAGDSPDFLPRWTALADKTKRQREAMVAAGRSTSEYDHHINDSVRRFLKAKGLSDAEIDAKSASGTDPLDAVKPYIGNDRDSQRLERAANSGPNTDAPRVATVAAPEKSQAAVSVDAISARLKVAGVQMTSDAPVDKDGHGLPAHGRERAGTALTLPS